jgi:DNA-binding CsgD family transcriptional regulator
VGEKRQLDSTTGTQVQRFASERGLTQAEANILQQLIDGLTPMQIAVEQDISIATVRTHIARLHEKCGVRRTLDLIRLALGARA